MRDHETTAALMRLVNEVGELRLEVRTLSGVIRKTNRLEIQNMKGLDDLKQASQAQQAALGNLATAVQASNQKIADLANKILNADDDDAVEAAANEILSHTAQVTDLTTSLQNAVTGSGGGTGGTGATGTGDGSGDAGGASGNGAGT